MQLNSIDNQFLRMALNNGQILYSESFSSILFDVDHFDNSVPAGIAKLKDIFTEKNLQEKIHYEVQKNPLKPCRCHANGKDSYSIKILNVSAVKEVLLKLCQDAAKKEEEEDFLSLADQLT